MDENMIFRKKNKVYADNQERMMDNLADITGSKMKTYDQFQKQQYQESQADYGFTLVNEQKDEFYSTDRVRGNVLMINELIDNADSLQLSRSQKEDLNIRRNRVKDFELLNSKTKDDSKEMTNLKGEIRQYDMVLSMMPKSREELEAFCKMAEEKCNEAIESCNDYLKRGKSLKFWKKNRNERYHLVEEARERYLKDKDVLATLSQLTDVEKFLRDGDTMLDLLNLETVNERLVAYDLARRQEREARERAAEEEDLRLDEELKQMEEELDDREKFEERAENVNEFFAGAEEQAEDQLLDEELKQLEEELNDHEEGYQQAEGVKDLFTAEEKRLQREEKRQAGEKQAENVGEFFKDVEERQRLDEWIRGVEERIHWDLQMEQEAQDVNDFFDREETRKRREEKRQAGENQAENVNEFFAGVEKQRLREEGQKRGEETRQRRRENRQANEQSAEKRAENVNEFFAGEETRQRRRENRQERGQSGENQAEGVNNFFTVEEKRLQREEKGQSGENWAENVDDYFTEVEKQQKLDEWFRGVKDRIHWDLQMEQVAEDVNAFFEDVEEQQRQEEEARQTEQQQQQHVRSVSYDLDEKNSGLETKTIVAGASIVTEIKDTKTKQKVYFRQGENAGGWNSEELVKNFMESIKGEIQLSDAMKENLMKAFGDLMPQQLLDRIREAYTQQNEKELKGAIDQLDGFGMVGYRSSNFRRNIDSFVQSATCPGLLKDVYRNATDKVRTEIGKAFTLFARKQFQWSYSVGSAGIDPEQSLTDRSVATSKLAGLLGIGSMVSDSGTAVIKKDGKEITGNVTEDAGGKTIDRMKGTWSYSDKAIGQAYTLQVFDMICGQIDRHHENYRVIEKNQNVDSIKAVNNEMSFGKLTWEKIAAGYENISPLTESHVRAMPIAVINQILSLDEKALQDALGDVLDNDSMHYLLDRLAGVQKSIVEYAKNGKAGLQLSKDGKTAEFTGEDQDDTLRMLKAVKKDRGARTMIWWDNLTEKTLDEKIETRKKELARKE